MEKKEKDRDDRGIGHNFVTYDPEDLPYQKLHICKIIRDLPELTPEDIERYREE